MAKCIVQGCKEDAQVFAEGKGRPSSRCPQHNRELRAVKKEFDRIQAELIRLGDQSGRIVRKVSRFTRKSA